MDGIAPLDPRHRGSHRPRHVANGSDIDYSLRFLRLVWVDISGIRRCRCIPLNKHRAWGGSDRRHRSFAVAPIRSSRGKYFVRHTSRLALVCYFLPCHGDEGIAQNAIRAGDIVLEPVPGAVVELPFSPDCLAPTNILLDVADGTGFPPHPWCPRGILEASVRLLSTVHGLQVDVGFETEFVLLKSVDGKLVPVESSVYCQSSGFDVASDVLRDIVKALGAAGQRVIHLHGESAPGQFEVVTEHSGDVVKQADDFVVRKEVIQHVARNHGLVVTFLPKYFQDQAGSASHVHVSVKPLRRRGNAEGRGGAHGVGHVMARFMAGILHNIDSLLLHTVGSPNSYRRLQPGCWAGAYACWGVQNKEAPLRVIDADTNHVEFKAFDCTANPYLGLTALLCAGMAGLADDSLALPAPVAVDPRVASAGNPSVRRLPTGSFGEIVEACLGKHIDEKFARAKLPSKIEHHWLAAMGGDETAFQEFFEDFAMVKMAEMERFRNVTFDEEVRVLCQRY
jgi:glutamine synthetase